MIMPRAGGTARRVRVLDATLRDGDQAALFAFSTREKLDIALALAGAGVDVIEAGFPLSSRVDGEACALVARELSSRDGPSVSLFCRATIDDAERTARFFAPSGRSVLHLSLPVSELHVRAKFGGSLSAVLDRAVSSVRAARSLADEVEIGAEDATRAERAFLAEYCDAVTAAGARTVNIADTVGRALPGEFGELVSWLRSAVPAFRDGSAAISVHCHDDLGLAAANTVSAIQSGCAQIEVCALGLGERAGNAALEELAAILAVRGDALGATTGIDFPALAPLSRLVARACGTSFSPLKSVTGSSARAHASGIHQHALSRDPETYAPSAGGALAAGGVSLAPERIVLSRHSGKAGVVSAARAYAGIDMSPDEASDIMAAIKETLPDGESALGVTEFLSLLRDRGRYSAPIARCRDVRFSSGRGRCRVSADVRFGGAPTGIAWPARRVTGRGRTPLEAARDLVARATGVELDVRVLSVMSFEAPSDGRAAEAKWRAYLEFDGARVSDGACCRAVADDRVFAVERVERDRDLAFVRALLDAANVARRRALFDGFREGVLDGR